MNNTYYRNPEWIVKVQRPDYTKSTITYKTVPEWSQTGYQVSKVEFSSSLDKTNYLYGNTDLIGYEYEESIGSPGNPFSLTLVPIEDKKGHTWKDKIKARDVVSIIEFGKVRYIGIVKSTGYSSSMDNNGNPIRSIVISGESLGGMISSFNLPMNLYLWYNVGADAANRKLFEDLNSVAAKGQSIGEVFRKIKEDFFEVVFGADFGGFIAVLDAYFSLDIDKLEAYYPMNLKPFQIDTNNLWEIFRQIAPTPIYELFGRFEKDKYRLICRETPFDTQDWNKLKRTEINTLYLISQNLSDSDGQVYTHYFSQMPNSALTEAEIWVNSSLSEISVFDKDKLPIYGYNQLKATFPFFDLDKGRAESSINFLKNNSARMYAWYKNNVDFLSGKIEMMTVPDKENNYISIGERISHFQGSNNSIEFYVEAVKRKMDYPGTMTSEYSVTRGYEYGYASVTVEGVTLSTPQVKRISQQGRKMIQSEKDITGGR